MRLRGIINGKRLKQWFYALRLAGVSQVPWFGLLQAILSGPVPRKIWRARLRYGCFKCPLYSKDNGVMLCKSSHPDMLGLGCGCYLPFTALWANPEGAGCFGQSIDLDLGWPPYYWPSRWARIKSTLDFIFNRHHK